MMRDALADTYREIAEHESNRIFTEQGYEPLFVASREAKIVIVGQAPGIRAQSSGLPWNDASGQRLMKWLGVSEAQFRDPALFAHIPMDFYYPGKGKTGDLPPRKDFAPLWHTRIRSAMPNVELTIVIGTYAQRYYLQNNRYPTLTQTVHNYKEFLPDYFPLVHPSPSNFRWFAKHPWFEEMLVPEMQVMIADILQVKTVKK